MFAALPPTPTVVERYLAVDGGRVRYLRCGKGPTLLLLHGFPEDATEFRKVMPSLGRRFTVIAPDLRGIGHSTSRIQIYDPASLAGEVRQLIVRLKLGTAYVMGNDIGGPVGYAYARLYPKATRGLMLLEAPLVGMPAMEKVKSDPRVWHVSFHLMPRLPEALIRGHEFVYFREQFFGRIPPMVSDGDVRKYARSYSSPSQLHAGLGVYRAMPEQAKFNRSHANAFDIPIVVVGGSKVFGPLAKEMADGLRSWGCTNVTSVNLPGSRHYIVDEQPGGFIKFLLSKAK